MSEILKGPISQSYRKSLPRSVVLNFYWRPRVCNVTRCPSLAQYFESMNFVVNQLCAEQIPKILRPDTA